MSARSLYHEEHGQNKFSESKETARTVNMFLDFSLKITDLSDLENPFVIYNGLKID